MYKSTVNPLDDFVGQLVIPELNQNLDLHKVIISKELDIAWHEYDLNGITLNPINCSKKDLVAEIKHDEICFYHDGKLKSVKFMPIVAFDDVPINFRLLSPKDQWSFREDVALDINSFIIYRVNDLINLEGVLFKHRYCYYAGDPVQSINEENGDLVDWQIVWPQFVMPGRSNIRDRIEYM